LSKIIYQDTHIKIEEETFEIPWIKVFTQKHIKEFSQCNQSLRLYILDILDIIEKIMIKEFNPDKINIASFGNYVPHVHFHIQSRFKNDSYFPEPTWGNKQRTTNLSFENIDGFHNKIKQQLEEYNLDK
jgi:diadenosine tetraphosphate (Ap4A) HIT family hydrolase